MYEVIVKIYDRRKLTYIVSDCSGFFNTEKAANLFLKQQLLNVLHLNSEDLQIDVKYFVREEETEEMKRLAEEWNKYSCEN